MDGPRPFRLIAWREPHDVDADAAEALVRRWLDAGGDPADAPFEPSTDVGWFVRELLDMAPAVQVVTDARPVVGKAPIWLATTEQPPARVAAMHLPAGDPREIVDDILSLAAKYDLVVFDPFRRTVIRPLEVMAAVAHATFWPAGAIRGAVAGVIGAVLAIGAWSLGIPIVSGAVAVVGVFLVVLSVVTFVAEVRQTLSERRTGPRS